MRCQEDEEGRHGRQGNEAEVIKPSRQVISALATLQGQHDFEVIRDWLQRTLDDLTEINELTKDEVQVRWNQGAAQQLRELLRIAREARSLLH